MVDFQTGPKGKRLVFLEVVKERSSERPEAIAPIPFTEGISTNERGFV